MNAQRVTRKTAIGSRRHPLILTLMLGTLLSAAIAGTPPEPPIRAPAPQDILKNRYISIDPLGALGDNPPNLHISVSVDSTLVNGLNFDDGHAPIVWWADPPDARCISYVTTTKPAVEPDWSACPIVHLTGCPIIPTTAYLIVVESEGVSSGPGFESFTQCFDGVFPMAPAVLCDLGNGNADCTSISCSTSAECPTGKLCEDGFCTLTAGGTCERSLLRTQLKPGVKWHGDCVGHFNGTEWTPPNGQTNIDDAVAAIKTFQRPSARPGCGIPPCNATHTSVTDTAPNLTPGSPNNKIVSIEDVLINILGFQGQEYPGSELTRCP